MLFFHNNDNSLLTTAQKFSFVLFDWNIMCKAEVWNMCEMCDFLVTATGQSLL